MRLRWGYCNSCAVPVEEKVALGFFTSLPDRHVHHKTMTKNNDPDAAVQSFATHRHVLRACCQKCQALSVADRSENVAAVLHPKSQLRSLREEKELTASNCVTRVGSLVYVCTNALSGDGGTIRLCTLGSETCISFLGWRTL